MDNGFDASPKTILSTASTNASLVQTGETRLLALTLTNPTATVAHVKFFDKATAPIPGTDTPLLNFNAPANVAGAGIPVPIPDRGYIFHKGLGIAITGGSALLDATNAPAGVQANFGVWPGP